MYALANDCDDSMKYKSKLQSVGPIYQKNDDTLRYKSSESNFSFAAWAKYAFSYTKGSCLWFKVVDFSPDTAVRALACGK